MPNPELLTTDEVAELYRVHVQTVRRWVRNGRLRAFRQGGGPYRISRSDVDALLGGVLVGLDTEAS